MGKFANGKNSYALSDRSGVRYRYKDMRREWNGLLVGKDEYESKHKQLGPFRKVVDAQALKDARPDRTEPEVTRLLQKNPFSSGDAGTSIITVFEPSHGRTTGDKVEFKKANGFDGFTKASIELAGGYTITVSTTDRYTFTASSGTATAGNTRGGGEDATVGPIASSSTSASTFDLTSVTLDATNKTFDEA